MKNIIAFLLVISCLLVIAACGSTPETSGPQISQSTPMGSQSSSSASQPGADIHAHVFDKNGQCTKCETKASEGFEYKPNFDNTAFGIVSIGTCTDTDLLIPNYHEDAAVTFITYSAFKDQTQLTSVFIPDNILIVNLAAFSGCTGLVSAIIAEGVDRIEGSVFENCTALTSITIPTTIKEFDAMVLGGCTALKEIHYTGTMEQWATIDKGDRWDEGSGEYTIYCIDGKIKKGA